MAFNSANFTYLEGSPSNNYGIVYKYSTTDSTSTVNASNYFNTGDNSIRINDIILVKASDGVETLNVTGGSHNGTSVSQEVFVSGASNLTWNNTTIF